MDSLNIQDMPDDLFLFNPRNNNIFTGEKIRDWGQVPFMVVVAIIFIVGVFVLIRAVDSWQLYSELSQYGAVTTATYTDRDIETRQDASDSGTSTTTYYLEYEYVVDDTIYEGRHRTSLPGYDNFEPGGAVSVLYLPDEPETSIAGTQPPVTDALFTAVMGFVIIGVALVLGLRVYLNFERPYDPKKDGDLIYGELKAIDIEPPSNGGNSLAKVKIAYTSPQTGEVVTADDQRYLKPDRVESPPTPGTPIAILLKKNGLHQLL